MSPQRRNAHPHRWTRRPHPVSDPERYLLLRVLARAVLDATSRHAGLAGEAREWLCTERAARYAELAGRDIRQWQRAAGVEV